MFICLLTLYFIIFPTSISSQCYSVSSQTWICNGYYKSNTPTYQTILNKQYLKNFYLKNYKLRIFKIDHYSLTLRLLNASGNQFQSVIITSKNRFISNLRQLILQSNHIEQFNIDTIILPNSLEKISLANNQLTTLDARVFLHLKNLNEIDLRNNQLKRILPDLLLNKHIQLDNNPLDCQCTTEKYRIRCEKATNLRSRRVREFDRNDIIFKRRFQ